MAALRIPVATYRLQFNSAFTFRDASAITRYLNALGISDLYASSYLKAVPGSGHGYDVADPTRLNPDIGTDEDYWAWVAGLHAHDMSHLIDLVPNHMGIAGSSNAWWLDVLENGPSSRFARFFDIEWRPVKDELADKLLIPLLGDQYGATLERQELRLAYCKGAFTIRYHDDWLPVAPDTFARILGPGLEAWTSAHAQEIDSHDLVELQSVIHAAGHLPARGSRSLELIADRAREKEVVKRRLAAVVDRSPSLRAYVEAMLVRYNGVAGDPGSFDLLDQLLGEQSYRLAHWRVASEEINYRRFFDVNQLAALRMEDLAVFDEVHRFVFDLVARGAASGVRIDHVDGLYSPVDYLSRLHARSARPLFVVVEKILARDEQLPSEWPVHGTTGYEFAATVNNLFVDGRHERTFDDIYRQFIHERADKTAFDDLVYRSKKRILHETMSGDINSLGHQLNRLSERNRHFRDFTLYSLISTLKEVIACFPVYRTYITVDAAVADQDRRSVARAIRSAKRRAPGVTSLVFHFIERLLLRDTGVPGVDDSEELARFIGKFQQITGPVAAKGIEDTALYAYNRLLSLNEVGSDPTQFGLEPAAVHQWMACRLQRWPAALSATSTHDSKRGEDVRARLNVLSEMPGAWKSALRKWRALNRRFKSDAGGWIAPDPNEEYFIYQTLVGAWPFEPDQEPAFIDRLKCYLVKALREAKVHTSWSSPDESYEAAVLRFVDSILDPRRPFLRDFRPFQARIAELGIYNSLAQTLVKMTAPGVPDFYQGTELWDLSLVDPDNRRPVDYSVRRQLLGAIGDAPDDELVTRLLDDRRSGSIKLWTVARALGVRKSLQSVFEGGEYLPLSTTGAHAESLFAFARRAGDAIAISCVPRLVATLVGDRATPPICRPVWEDTRIALPATAVLRYRNVFSGRVLCACEGTLEAAAIFDRFPVALLVGERAEPARTSPFRPPLHR